MRTCIGESSSKSMERLRFIDATKGILIFLVIAGHVPFAMIKLGGIPSSAIELWGEINYNTFASFYMPSFFFITGYCSNFSKPLETFIKDNLATLILPCLLLSSPTNWFVMALFVAKLLYYYINRLCKKYSDDRRSGGGHFDSMHNFFISRMLL